jgi:hypothetical protein
MEPFWRQWPILFISKIVQRFISGPACWENKIEKLYIWYNFRNENQAPIFPERQVKLIQTSPPNLFLKILFRKIWIN